MGKSAGGSYSIDPVTGVETKNPGTTPNSTTPPGYTLSWAQQQAIEAAVDERIGIRIWPAGTLVSQMAEGDLVIVA